MIEVPLHVINQGNEVAYIAGAYRNMAAKAAKAFAKRRQDDVEFNSLVNFIETKASKGSGFFVSMEKAIREYGKLSQKQEETCRRIMNEEAVKMAEIRSRDAGSEFVGSIKERRMFTVQITGFKVMVNPYDESPDGYFHAMKDANGNVLVYRGSVKLGEKGDEITFKATVKSHYDGKGVKTTYLNRPVK